MPMQTSCHEQQHCAMCDTSGTVIADANRINSDYSDYWMLFQYAYVMHEESFYKVGFSIPNPYVVDFNYSE